MVEEYGKGIEDNNEMYCICIYIYRDVFDGDV